MGKWAWLALAAVVVSGCTTHADGTTSTNKTAVGAAVGAIAGGLLGNRLDRKKRGRGTVIGAVAGAAAGGGLGYLMDRQEAELREQLASERAEHAVEVERVRDDVLKLTLDSAVSFDTNSAAIKPAFRPSLAKVAEVLSQYDNRVSIIGHTDATGAESYNQSLSERRAEAVRGELARLGVPAAQIDARGRGELEPVADNGTAAGRARNRRVEVLIQTVS